MASKRRNMFQKNKTQETTENGRLYEMESKIEEKKVPYFEDMDGADPLEMSLEELQVYTQQVYQAVVKEKFERDAFEIETNKMVKYWKITSQDLKQAEVNLRRLLQKKNYLKMENEKRVLDARWDSRLEQYKNAEDLANKIRNKADFRKSYGDNLQIRNWWLEQDAVVLKRQIRNHVTDTIHCSFEQGILHFRDKERVRDKVHLENGNRESNLRSSHQQELDELRTTWLEDVTSEAARLVDESQEATKRHLDEQRQVLTAYSDIHSLYFIHIDALRPKLSAAVEENTAAKVRLSKLAAINSNLTNKIQHLARDIRLSTEHMAHMEKEAKKRRKESLTGSHEKEALNLSSTMYNTTVWRVSQLGIQEYTDQLSKSLATEILDCKYEMEKRRIYYAEKVRMVDYAIAKCDQVLANHPQLLEDEEEVEVCEELEWSAPRLEETSWEEYDVERMTFRNLYQLYNMHFRKRGDGLQNFGYKIDRRVVQ
ncbi:hypothetical protein AAG570_003575 [Ranatra chinensis]|uniref:Uncharacterized protein n=1 Tax=Ranatra chinensis TaxID=642074 RepID=A0ABD0Y435_9HEMI